MDGNRGVALILALLVLSFLTILGSALLTTSAIDIWISDNYRNATQSLYIAEAGVDDAREVLRTSTRTLSELLATGDPIISSHQLVDSAGQSAGYYEVWLRNDNADGMTSPTDSNGLVTLISTGQIGGTRKTIEVTVQKGRFPDSGDDPELKTVAGLETLAARITNNATDVFTTATLMDFGDPTNYRVAAASGTVNLGPGTGYGLLLVRGDLNIAGNVTWNGLIAVIGQGVLNSDPGAVLTVNGGVFVARTQASDGSLLSAPAGVKFDITDAGQIRAASRSFPYNPIAIKEK